MVFLYFSCELTISLCLAEGILNNLSILDLFVLHSETGFEHFLFQILIVCFEKFSKKNIKCPSIFCIISEFFFYGELLYFQRKQIHDFHFCLPSGWGLSLEGKSLLL